MIISDITNPFFTAVARGVEDEINRHGYHTIFCNTDEDPAREDEYLRLLSARQIDGLIIASTGIRSERLRVKVSIGGGDPINKNPQSRNHVLENKNQFTALFF